MRFNDDYRMPQTDIERPLYVHPHSAANEPVTPHEGPLNVQIGTGAIALRRRLEESTAAGLEKEL